MQVSGQFALPIGRAHSFVNSKCDLSKGYGFMLPGRVDCNLYLRFVFTQTSSRDSAPRFHVLRLEKDSHTDRVRGQDRGG